MEDRNPFRRAAKPFVAGVPTATSFQVPVPSSVPLTPLQAHYLKKTLVKLQLQRELNHLLRPDGLELLGPPFRSSRSIPPTQMPLLRHVLHEFIITFPFFDQAPEDFFSNKVQAFVERMLERNIISVSEGDEASSAVTGMVRRSEKYLSMLIGSAIRVRGVQEDIVRINDQDRQRLSALDAQRASAMGQTKSTVSVNIVGVRTVIERGIVRSPSHNEFLVRTVFKDQAQVVSRRYRDFVKMHKELAAKMPSEDLPDLPPKDHSNVKVSGVLQDEDNDEYMDMTATTPSELVREKNRLTLRAYLRSLLSIPAVADSDTFRAFLTDSPTTLTSSDLSDIDTRRKADAVREAEHQEFSAKMSERVSVLQEHLGTFKGMLMEPDGLSRVFQTIRQCPHVSQLPPEYRVLLDWATVSMASGLFTMFVGRDSSSSAFAQLKYMHSVMPYFMVRSILKISNPIAMMRSLLDLFLLQPFGQKSLLQRMFTGRLQEEIAEMKQLLYNVQTRVAYPVFCQKVDAYVAMTYDMQQLFNEQASAEQVDELTVVLRSPLHCELNERQLQRISRATAAYGDLQRRRKRAAARGAPEPEPDNDDAWLLEDLHVYMNLQRAIRQKEQLVSLIYDSSTTELLKDMITIFYAPLAQVYRAANIGDTLGDVQTFINDLIKTVEEHQTRTSHELTPVSASQPQQMVGAFVSLVQRHQQMFYNFVYQVHTKGSNLFVRLVQWVEHFINYVRDPKEPESCGLGYVDLEQCLPSQGEERQRILREVDGAIQHAYHLKLQRELKMRRKMAHAAVTGAANERAEDEAFITAMSENFGFGSSLQDEVAELDDDTDSELEHDDDDSDSDTEPEEADARASRQQMRLAQTNQGATPPSTQAIERLLPLFVGQLVPKLMRK
ncbi:hypothetical protein MCAP1_003601 [Malassezia caprae]|uniref:PX domain-containing protein n=1 Tax=Malassezia caprae TaxID=1381934 RepID=A0AAF0IX04_9BASI|nr:hypothetical protein MCAP1_003601 [Malassezia caprae]